MVVFTEIRNSKIFIKIFFQSSYGCLHRNCEFKLIIFQELFFFFFFFFLYNRSERGFVLVSPLTARVFHFCSMHVWFTRHPLYIKITYLLPSLSFLHQIISDDEINQFLVASDISTLCSSQCGVVQMAQKALLHCRYKSRLFEMIIH